MSAGLLNVGSLVLGLIAWMLPIINLAKHDKHEHKNWSMLSAISLMACAVSLYFQILYNNHLVNIEDWSALMDTSYAVSFVSAVMLLITVTLNVIVFVKYRKINQGL